MNRLYFQTYTCPYCAQWFLYELTDDCSTQHMQLVCYEHEVQFVSVNKTWVHLL